MSHESASGEGPAHTESRLLFEKHADLPITLEYRGAELTYSLRNWLSFCPDPEINSAIDNARPEKMREVIDKLQRGENPFADGQNPFEEPTEPNQ